MTYLGAQKAISFTAIKHLNTADISGSYGFLRVPAAVVMAAIMAVLVFVGGANACHHNSETAEQTSTELPRKAYEKTEAKA